MNSGRCVSTILLLKSNILLLLGLWCLCPVHYALPRSNSSYLELQRQHQSLNLVFSLTVNSGEGGERRMKE